MALTPFQSMLVANDCVRFVTGSNRPLNPSEQLVRYGVNTTEQCALIRHNIGSNGAIGVQRFNHSLNPAFLATLSKSWTFAQLAGTIQANAQINSDKLAFTEPTFTNAEKAAIAKRKFEEAVEILSSLPKSTPKPKVSTEAFTGMNDKTLAAYFAKGKKAAGKKSK